MQLDWFDFETRMRKLILDLLTPYSDKASDDRGEITKLRKLLDGLDKRIFELEFILKKESQPTTVFDMLEDKIAELEKLRTEERQKVLDEFNNTKQEVANLGFICEKTTSHVQAVEKRVQHTEDNFKALQQEMKDFEDITTRSNPA